MTLAAGSKLGPCAIVLPIGAGGMGGRRARLRRDLGCATGVRLGQRASTVRLIPARRALSRGVRLLRSMTSRRLLTPRPDVSSS